VRGFCSMPGRIPLLSCVCGNASPGAPVTVPMSGLALQGNQGGTVEYKIDLYPTPDFSGAGIFYAFPTLKEVKTYGKRKPVHL